MDSRSPQNQFPVEQQVQRSGMHPMHPPPQSSAMDYAISMPGNPMFMSNNSNTLYQLEASNSREYHSDMHSQAAPSGIASTMSYMSSPMSMQEQRDQTNMWANQHYFADSGIHSSTTRSVASSSRFSGISSLTGMESECGEYYGSSAYAPPSENLFVHVENAAGEMSSGAADVSQTGQFFFQFLSSADNDWQASLPAAIENLIIFLNDDDQQTKREAASLIYNVAKRLPTGAQLLQNSNLIRALISTMSLASDGDGELQKYAISTLCRISTSKSGAEWICQHNGIAPIVALLKSNMDPLANYAATTLHYLLDQHIEGANNAVRTAGGVPILVALLQKDHDKFVTVVADCLRLLCFNDPATKATVFCNDGLTYLVQILKRSVYEKLLYTTARLLQALSVCEDYKLPMLKLGVMDHLVSQLSHESNRLVEQCLYMLLNLSNIIPSAVARADNLLDALLKYLGSSNMKVVCVCSAIIANLMFNLNNRAYLLDKDGISYLVRTLFEKGLSNAQVASELLSAMRQLVSPWPRSGIACNKLLSSDCLKRIGDYLQLAPELYLHHPSMAKEALDLIGKMALASEQSMPEFRKYNIIELLCNFLSTVCEMIRRPNMQAPQLNICFDILTKNLGVLTIIAKDPTNCQILMGRPHTVKLIEELIEHAMVENIKNVAIECRTAIGMNFIQPDHSTSPFNYYGN